MIKQFNTTEQLNRYPGSPLIIKHYLRKKDRLFLYELHSTEIQRLNEAVRHDRRIKVFHADGLKNVVCLLPPDEHRGLVLIDPSYEIKSDYEQVTETLIKIHNRFAVSYTHLTLPTKRIV